MKVTSTILVISAFVFICSSKPNTSLDQEIQEEDRSSQVEHINLCGETLDWKRVRHVPSGHRWHPTNDNLVGTAQYGHPSDDSKPWSVKWSLNDFDEFLFISGNKKYWVRATKAEIIGNDGKRQYANKPIKLTSSNLSCAPSTAKLYRRLHCCEPDPLISARDHHSTRDMVYAEFSYNFFTNLLQKHCGGFDVYIRRCD